MNETIRYDVAIGTVREVAAQVHELVVEDSSKVAMYIVVGVVILLELALFAFGHRNAKLGPLRSASWPFCQGIFAGAIVACASTYLLGQVSDFTCSARLWFFCLSFDTIIGLLVVKTHRLSLIFNMRTIMSQKLTDGLIFRLWIFYIVAPDALLLGLWNIVSRPTRSIHTLSNGNYLYQCQGDHDIIFSWIIIVLKIMLLAYGVYLASKTWSINPKFNESRLIAVTIYTVTLLSGFGLPLSSVLSEQPNALYVFRTVTVLLVSLSTLVILFVPKYYLILKLDSSEFLDQEESASQGLQSSHRGRESMTSPRARRILSSNGALNKDMLQNLGDLGKLCTDIHDRQEGGLIVHESDVDCISKKISFLHQMFMSARRSQRLSVSMGGHSRRPSAVPRLAQAVTAAMTVHKEKQKEIGDGGSDGGDTAPKPASSAASISAPGNDGDGQEDQGKGDVKERELDIKLADVAQVEVQVDALKAEAASPAGTAQDADTQAVKPLVAPAATVPPSDVEAPADAAV